MPTSDEIGYGEDEAYDDFVARVDEGKQCPRCHNDRAIRTRLVPTIGYECPDCKATWTHFSRETT